MYLNKVFLYGNLTRDPEVKTLPTGNIVTAFGLATNRSFVKRDGTSDEQTEFHNVVAFGKTAQTIGQYLKKGRAVYIDGRLQTRNWEDKETGKKVYRTEIIVDSFQFGEKKMTDDLNGEFEKRDKSPADEKIYAPAITPGGGYPDDEINPEDIPF